MPNNKKARSLSRPSKVNFTATFDAALVEYRRVTGQRLESNPSVVGQFKSCDSPEDILKVLQAQRDNVDEFRRSPLERLLLQLNPTFNVLLTLSGALGDAVGLAFPPTKAIFTGLGILLSTMRDVSNYDKLIGLFDRIRPFLSRLDDYIDKPLTSGLKELIEKILAQILLILALLTNVMGKRWRMRTHLQRLVEGRNVEETLLWLDLLTNVESLATLGKAVDVKYRRDVNCRVKATGHMTEDFRRKQLEEKLRAWLSPPDPFIDHTTAREIQHRRSATSFIQGKTFQEWKTQKSGSLLWIRGKKESGKTVLCSAIIEDIRMNIRKDLPALIAYYYFNRKDASKRDVRGLLASLLFQLGYLSERCWDILHRLYITSHDCPERPSDADLELCLKSMLGLQKNVPIFVIIDALDECPGATRTPSPGETVLQFVEDLIRSNTPNLFICVTSRSDRDIQDVLGPLTFPRYQILLHDEQGQIKVINDYLRSFDDVKRAMRAWPEEDKKLVITALSELADGTIPCVFDTLRLSTSSSLGRILDELPINTYERLLQGIPEKKRQSAHRLFRCLVGAMRPFSVEELAEIFATNFDSCSEAPKLVVDQRPEDPEKDILSKCPSLITITEYEGSKIVQFFPLSVKEFLTSDRLQNSEVGSICHFHISPDAAHTILARACLAVLLHLGEKIDQGRLATSPLAFYAARHWVDHAYFGNLASQIQDTMKCLFNPQNPYLATWTRIYDVDSHWVGPSLRTHSDPPSRRQGTALYYAALCGFGRLVSYLITTHAEDVNANCGLCGTPLHAATYMGHLDAAHVLIHYGAELNARNNLGRTPLSLVCGCGDLEVMRMLLESGADVDATDDANQTPLHAASTNGQLEAMRMLLDYRASVDARDNANQTPLYAASTNGHLKAVMLLLERGADANTQTTSHSTPLHGASESGHLWVVKMLLMRGADMHTRDGNGWTPLEVAKRNGHKEVAKLLSEHGVEED